MVKPDAILVYKETEQRKLNLHMFKPEGYSKTDKRPAVLFFFGGGWNNGTPIQFYPQCSYLATRGLVAFSAEYRVASSDHTSPRECVKDGKSAIRWIRQHAKELGIDSGRIIAGGGSAGAHVAAAAGTVKGLEEKGENLNISSRPDGLVLFNPVFDNGPDGYGYDRVKAYWEDFSPLHNINRLTPPSVVFLGTEDQHIPEETARKFKKRMEEENCRCDLHLYEGQSHGFFNSDDKGYLSETIGEMDRFLVSLGYLPV